VKTINRLFFVLGDVFLPCVYSVSLELLKKRGLDPVDQDRIGIHSLEGALLTGSLTELDFLHRVALLLSEKIPITESDLLSSLSVDHRPLSVVSNLRKDKEVFLFSDYPKPWLEMIDRNVDLISSFNKVIYSQDLHCSNLQEDIFTRLKVIGEIKEGSCLWVDKNSFRTSRAIHNGIDAIIYVDERRLRRELSLRSLL
jgi:hypothetical protein